jgi:hypothetical protein
MELLLRVIQECYFGLLVTVMVEVVSIDVKNENLCTCWDRTVAYVWRNMLFISPSTLILNSMSEIFNFLLLLELLLHLDLDLHLLYLVGMKPTPLTQPLIALWLNKPLVLSSVRKCHDNLINGE